VISFSHQVSRFVLNFAVEKRDGEFAPAGMILFVVSVRFEAFGKWQRLKNLHFIPAGTVSR